MGNRRPFHALIGTTAFFLILISLPRTGLGVITPTLDFDSLVFDAADIVEAHVLGPRKGRPVWVGDDVRVTAVYQGDVKQGDVRVVSGLSDSLKHFGNGDDSKGVGAGDDVILFLVSDTNPAVKVYQTDVLTPLSSGIRWIDNTKVISFHQAMNPGPMVADNDSSFPFVGSPSLALDDFRKTLKKSAVDMALVHERLKSALNRDDVPWLLQAVAARRPARARYDFINDDVLIALGNRLSKFRDEEIAYQALRANPEVPVSLGFASPKGREFLIAKLTAADTPEPMRVALIRMIDGAGINYQWLPESERTARSRGIGESFAPHNASYATRVAHAVILSAGRDDVWNAFARMMSSWMLPTTFVHDAEYRKDVSDAALVLASFYKNGATERQQFDIESNLARVGRSEYEMLGNKRSPIDTIALFDETYAAGRPPPPYVLVRYQYFRLPWIDHSPDKPTSVQTIGRSLATGREFVVDPDPGGFGGVMGSSSNGPRSLPKNLPVGRYYVFLRSVQGNRVVGESHGFEIDQNGTPIAPVSRH